MLEGMEGHLIVISFLMLLPSYYKLRSLSYRNQHKILFSYVIYFPYSSKITNLITYNDGSDGVNEYAISKFLSQIFSSGVPLSGNIRSLVKEYACNCGLWASLWIGHRAIIWLESCMVDQGFQVRVESTCGRTIRIP